MENDGPAILEDATAVQRGRAGQIFLIRVDGDSRIGMGHVARMLVLARSLRTSGVGDPTFFMRPGPTAANLVREAGFTVFEVEGIDEPGPLPADIQILAPTLVIADLYEPSDSHLARLRALGRVIYMSSLDDIERNVDAIINGDIRHGKFKPLRNAAGAFCFLGTDVFVLGAAYGRTVTRPAVLATPDPRRVLISLGGADYLNATPAILESLDALDASKYAFEVELILGPAHVSTPAFEACVSRFQKPCRLVRSPSSLHPHLAAADLAIIGGGFTLYEAAATGLPALVLCQATHQESTARRFEEAGSCIHLGMADDPQAIARLGPGLCGLLRDPRLRDRMSRAGCDLVDGRGVERVTRFIQGALDNLDGIHHQDFWA